MIVRVTLVTLLMIVNMIIGGPVESDVTVIKGATVVDGTGRLPIVNGVIVIQGNTVKAVGAAGKIKIPSGATTVDATGKYVVPGLIDMHVHYREWHGELFLANGVTTVKDLGNPVEWISELSRMQLEGKLRGPRIFYVGNNLDAPPPEGDHHVGVASPAEIDRAVNLLFKFNVNAIKVRHKITPELLQAILRAAHAKNIPVTGHLAATNAKEAALAGIDGLEHATGVARAASDEQGQPPSNAKGLSAFFEDLRGFSQMNRAKESALIKLLVAKKVKLIPTLAVRSRAVADRDAQERARVADDGYARNQELEYVPQMVRRNWSEAPLDRKLQETFKTDELTIMREGYHRLEGFVLELHRAGGVVLAGSDTLNDVPGLTLHRELESLVAAGLSPMEALLAATRDAALFLGRANLGTIQPDRTADLVILGADPLTNIRNLDKVERVFQNGREVSVSFERGYKLPPPRPNLVRPLFFERLLAAEKE